MTECEKILEEFKELLEAWHNKKHRATHIGFRYSIGNVGIQVLDKRKEQTMQFSGMSVGWTVTVLGIPLKADGTQSLATLSNQAYQSSDPTVFTIAIDPNNAGGAIITLVGSPTSGASITATLTETATATEPDGTTVNVITGSDTLSFLGGGGPPTGVATSIGFTYGTPAAPGTIPVPPPIPNPAKKF